MHKMLNVETLWPKLVEPFVFDEAQGRSVKTDRTNKDGSYEVNLIVTPEQAKELATAMRQAHAAKAESVPNWPTGTEAWNPKSVDDLFKKDETGSGCFVVKCVQKTYGDVKTKPRQIMANGIDYADDFELTTGSKVHAMINIYCWKFGKKTGVTLQPKTIKVIEFKERIEGDPFAADQTPGADDPFGLDDAPTAPNNDIDDEIPF